MAKTGGVDIHPKKIGGEKCLTQSGGVDADSKKSDNLNMSRIYEDGEDEHAEKQFYAREFWVSEHDPNWKPIDLEEHQEKIAKEAEVFENRRKEYVALPIPDSRAKSFFLEIFGSLIAAGLIIIFFFI